MKKKVVIAGSASLQDKVKFWKKYWEKKGCEVINYPSEIKQDGFLEKYPKVHKKFFENINEADILFVMNEDKNGTKGYLGAESFAEMCYGVSQNLLNINNTEIILLQKPSSEVQSIDEINLWLKLKWIKLWRN